MTNHNSSPEDSRRPFPAFAVAIGAAAIFATSTLAVTAYETKMSITPDGTSFVDVSGIYDNLLQSHDADK